MDSFLPVGNEAGQVPPLKDLGVGELDPLDVDGLLSK